MSLADQSLRLQANARMDDQRKQLLWAGYCAARMWVDVIASATEARIYEGLMGVYYWVNGPTVLLTAHPFCTECVYICMIGDLNLNLIGR